MMWARSCLHRCDARPMPSRASTPATAERLRPEGIPYRSGRPMPPVSRELWVVGPGRLSDKTYMASEALSDTEEIRDESGRRRRERLDQIRRPHAHIGGCA